MTLTARIFTHEIVNPEKYMIDEANKLKKDKGIY